MLRCYLQTARNMVLNYLAQVSHVIFIDLRVFGFMQNHVVADTTANECFLHLRVLAYLAVQVEHWLVVHIQVFTHIGENTRRAFTAVANFLVNSLHLVHVG